MVVSLQKEREVERLTKRAQEYIKRLDCKLYFRNKVKHDNGIWTF